MTPHPARTTASIVGMDQLAPTTVLILLATTVGIESIATMEATEHVAHEGAQRQAAHDSGNDRDLHTRARPSEVHLARAAGVEQARPEGVGVAPCQLGK